jgi:fucose permease
MNVADSQTIKRPSSLSSAPSVSVAGERLPRHVVLGALMLTSFGAGIVLSILGPTAPAIATRLDLPVSALGVLFTASFLAATAATVASGALYHHVSGRVCIPAALLFMALGLLVEGTTATLPLVALGAALSGAGIGTINVYVNAVAVRLFPDRRETVLTTLGVCFGVGAFCTPLAAGLSLTRFGGYTLVYLAGSAMLLSPFLLLVRGLPGSVPAREALTSGRVSLLTLLRDRNLRLLMALAGLYLGAQIGFGGWIVSILAVMTHLPPARLAPAASAYWLSQAVGGVLTVLLLRRGASPRRLLALGALTAGVGAGLIIAVGSSFALAVAGCALVGLSFAPILPMTMSLAAGKGSADGSDGPRLAAVFTTGQAGGAALPALQGALLGVNTALALWLTVVCALAMAGLASRVATTEDAS